MTPSSMIRGTSTLEGWGTLSRAGFNRIKDAVQVSTARGWDVSGEVSGVDRTVHIRSTDKAVPHESARQIVILGTFDYCVISFWQAGIQKQRREVNIRDALTLWYYVGILGFRDLTVDGNNILEKTEPGSCEMSFEWRVNPISEDTNADLIKRWQGLLDLLAKDD